MRPHETLALIICAALAAACSSQSQNTKPVIVSQAPAAASTSTSIAAVAVAGTAAVAAAPAGSADPNLPKADPALVKQGYRVVRHQGKILYCQTQSVTGTKFASTTCQTAEQIQELNRETEQSKRLLIRSGPANCVGTQCSN
jgi:hypothetical protein